MSVRERDASGQHMTGDITYTYLGDGAAVVNLSAPQSASTGALILEQNGYHPFGTKIDLGRNLSTNRWHYAGKEEQDIAGMDLRLLDFGARFYDPYTLRWNAVGPLAHKYFSMSPYNYCGNDPVNRVDPDGEDIFVFDAEGKYVNTIEDDGEDYIQWNRVDSEGNEYVMKVSFVDPQNDPNSINSSTKLVYVTDQSIINSLEQSGAMNSENHGLKKGCLYLLQESNAASLSGEGKLDFTGSGQYGIAIENSLYAIPDGNHEGVAHNSYNYGNFLWGASTAVMGVPTFIARLGADINNFCNDSDSKYLLDSRDDQRSIQMGADWVKRHKNK